MPTLLRNLERAHVRFAAVGLVARHHGHALVVDLQELRVRQVEILSRRVVSHVLLKGMRDQRQAAGLGARGIDDAYPVGIGLSIEGPGVVVNAIGKKLETRALGGSIAILARPSSIRAL